MPLLLFVIIESFAGLKAGLIGAIVLALFEGIASYLFFGELDWLTLMTLFLVFVMAAMSYWSKTDLHFKLQPVIVAILIGLTFIITYFMGQPIFYEFAMKYKDVLPAENAALLANPIMQQKLKNGTLTLGISQLLLAGACAYTAFRASNWVWIATRVFGFYLFSFIAFVIA